MREGGAVAKRKAALPSWACAGWRTCEGKRFVRREHIVAVVGMALFWPVLRNPFLLGLLSSERSEMGLAARYTLFFAAAAFAAAVAYALVRMCRARAAASPDARPDGWWLGIVGRVFVASAVAAGAGYLACVLLNGAGVVVFAVGCACCACATSGAVFAWFSVLGRFELAEALGVCALSFALSFLSFSFDLLPEAMLKPAQAFFPVSSCLIGYALSRRLAVSPSGAAPSCEQEAGAKRGWLVVALCLVCLFASIFVSAINASMLTSYMAKPGSYLTYAVSALSALCLVVVFRASRHPQVMLAGGLLVGAAVVLLAAFSMLGLGTGMGLPTTSHTVMEFLLFACLLSVRETSAASAQAALFVIAASAISWCERVVLPYLFSVRGAQLTDFGTSMALVACAIVSFLALASVGVTLLYVAKGASPLRAQASDADAADGDRRQGAATADDCIVDGASDALEAAAPVSHDAQPLPPTNVQRVASSHGLTPRETDVLELVARGYSVRKISETLCISPSTVQGHMRNVYAKLGLHSRQEVIDCCQDCI